MRKKESGEYKILVINPGSTSTKLSLFINEENLFTESVFHDSSVLLTFPTINDQLEYREKVISEFIEENHLDLSDLDAIVGRGGGCCPVRSGVYYVDEKLIEDTREVKGGLYHASMLGVQLAYEVQKKYGGLMLMTDPPVLDELWNKARITGLKGVYRRAVSHALNAKTTARFHAKRLGKRYEDMNLIVAHIDGGISITAHHKGRMVDGNDAGGGEGPFTPTRMGSLAVTDVIRVFRGKTLAEERDLCSQAGGLSSHFGTSDSDAIHRMIEEGDERAATIWNAMIYRVVKYIGSMATALYGEVDGILLTGGLLRFPDVEAEIRRSCEWIAPVTVYPGEMEQEAMAEGALRVLRGELTPKHYTGEPVWKGFRNNSRPDGLIFDIDGTLWDCTDSAAAGFTRALASDPEWARTVTGDDLKKLFGKTMDAIADALIPGYPKEKRKEFFAHCTAEEERSIRELGGHPFEGVAETLKYLSSKIPLFIVSNGQGGYPELFLEATGFGPYFTAHFTPDDNGKTKAGNIAYICEKYGLTSAYYVGDTVLDEEAAWEAGTPFIYASYGFGRADSPDLTIRSFGELRDLWDLESPNLK